MIFINQASGDLFSDVIDALRRLPGPHFLITGSSSRHREDVALLKCRALQRTSVFKRVKTWGLFVLQTFFYLLRHARNQHLLFVTNPPMTMWLAPFFKSYFKSSYSLLIYDIYPDALSSAGILSKHSRFADLWRKMNAFTLRGAEHVITITAGMAETLRHQMPVGQYLKVSVIENWVDTDFIKPLPKSENPIIRELNLQNKFIVSYAGSFGATHGVESIVTCADLLRDYPDIHFLLVGGGTKENAIRKIVREKALSNLTVLPYQPKERFRYVAAAPDVSLILLKSGVGRAIMPSKLYTALSAGVAVVAATESGSDLAQSVERDGYGVVIAPEDPKSMADSILHLAKDPKYLSGLKHNARSTAVKFYTMKKQCGKYMDIFRDVCEV